MEPFTCFFLPFIILMLPFTFLFLHYQNSKIKYNCFPPGPPGWPIIGNLLDLGRLPHRSLNDMKQKYGDLIGVRLGSIKTIVILSSKIATEFYRNHDIAFADRSITETMRIHNFNDGALALLPYGSQWRLMRKLVSVDMFGTKKLEETAFLRRKCVDDMLRWIDEEISSNKTNSSGFKVADFVFMMAFNLMGNHVFSRNVLDPKSRRCSEFVEALFGLLEMAEKIEVVDFFPWLKWVNKLRWRGKLERKVAKALKLASILVNERVEENKKRDIKGNRRKDFLDVLVEFEGNGKDETPTIPRHNMNVFMLEAHMALADNLGIIIEWALAELLRNPDEMKKAKAELASVAGPNMKVEETDIDNLPYLQAIIKETLRLHTPVPLLVPKKARHDTEFMGYHVPKDSQVFINVWAIGRDPELWDDPLSFKPERFMGSNIDYKGHHYEFLPFGGGRRICVGLPLSHRVIHLVLGSLIHEFDWELGDNTNPADLDMTERAGVTMRKLRPLFVVANKKTST